MPRLVLPEGMDEWLLGDMELKGYLTGALAECPDGRRYPVSFYQACVLEQDLAYWKLNGKGWLGEIGLIVIDQVNRSAMESALAGLWKQGWFNHLKPLE